MSAARPFARLSPRLTPSSAAILAALVFLLWTIVGTSWFMRNYFGLVTPDQVLFHLQHAGLGEADSLLYRRALRCLVGVVGLTLLSLFLLGRLRRSHRLPLLAALGVGAVLSVHATVSDPCEPETDGGDYFARHFVDPGRVTWQAPAGKPDVLVVFVESLDQGYTRPRDTQAPLLPQLTRLQNEAQTLGRLHNLSAATWTLGGLFGALCGVPLQPIGVMSHHSYDHASHFYAGGRCLTDVLAEQGWQVSFYGGASLKFAGKGHFLQEHGVARRFGAEQWRQAGVQVPTHGWGLLDTDLVKQAWADMQRPRDPGEARMSMVLTVDTHGPAGARDSGCESGAARAADEDDDVPVELMRGALRCTDRAVAQLVQRFVTQRDGRPKVVWIMGDHLNPAPLLDADLQPVAGGRTVFHALERYGADGRLLPGDDQRREFTHVDVLPTLAEAIGLRWAPQAHRLGLGVSLLAEERPATLIESDGMAHVDGRLSCRSPLFQRLWLNAV